MQGKRGSLLVTTLWLITILSTLAIAVANYLSVEVRLTRYRLARAQAKVLARSGVYLAMQRLNQDAQKPEETGGNYDWLGDEWAIFESNDPEADRSIWKVTASSGHIEVQISDVERQLALSTDVDTFARLVGSVPLAQAIVDYLDQEDDGELPIEAEPYYYQKNAPVVTIEELQDIPGMTIESYQTLKAFATPYRSETEPLNLNTVAPEVLRALGVSESSIQIIEQFREGPDGSDGHEQDGIFTDSGLAITQTLQDNQGVNLVGTEDGNLLISSRFGVASQIFVVVAEGVMENPPVRARVEAVVKRAHCPEQLPTPCIVAW
ncbi:MAG: general secretion pathway protein GspK, partial [Candidatus Omnitrophica bacterium]|nr:general secretion pathway protein GspK [Candidatus Omnitrophota bacterium]